MHFKMYFQEAKHLLRISKENLMMWIFTPCGYFDRNLTENYEALAQTQTRHWHKKIYNDIDFRK